MAIDLPTAVLTARSSHLVVAQAWQTKQRTHPAFWALHSSSPYEKPRGTCAPRGLDCIRSWAFRLPATATSTAAAAPTAATRTTTATTLTFLRFIDT